MENGYIGAFNFHIKDNHRDIKNYRPITILAPDDKVFEPRDTIY